MAGEGTAKSIDALVRWFRSGEDASRPPRVPCRQPDGSYDLCYRNASDQARVQRVCEVKVYDNCLAGARRSCSIAALREAKRQALVARVMSVLRWRSSNMRQAGQGPDDVQERVMSACLTQTERRCKQHAATFCLFEDSTSRR